MLCNELARERTIVAARDSIIAIRALKTNAVSECIVGQVAEAELGVGGDMGAVDGRVQEGETLMTNSAVEGLFSASGIEIDGSGLAERTTEFGRSAVVLVTNILVAVQPMVDFLELIECLQSED